MFKLFVDINESIGQLALAHGVILCDNEKDTKTISHIVKSESEAELAMGSQFFNFHKGYARKSDWLSKNSGRFSEILSQT